MSQTPTASDYGAVFWRTNKFAVSEFGPSATVWVMRQGNLDSDFSVDVVTSDLTAKAGVDYLPVTNRIYFSSFPEHLDSVQTTTIPVLDNRLHDGTRTFLVSIRPATGSPLLYEPSTAVVTILDNDTEAGPALGLNASILAVAPAPDGTVYVGGEFTSVDGYRRNSLARLHYDGTADTRFDPGPGADGPVSLMALQSDGRVVVCGSFSSIAGAMRPQIARLNPDGALDRSFDPASAWTDPVVAWEIGPAINALALQPDGKLLMASRYTNYAGVFRPGVARINADGSLDEAFNPDFPDFDRAAAAGRPLRVSVITLDRDGGILLGGDFRTDIHLPNSQIVRLLPNGVMDTNFVTDVSAQLASVTSISVAPDGNIYLSGDPQANGSAVFRLGSTGALDTAFNLDWLSPTYRPRLVGVRPNGHLLLGRSPLWGMTADGTLEWFNTTQGQPTSNFTITPDGRWVVGENLNGLCFIEWMEPVAEGLRFLTPQISAGEVHLPMGGFTLRGYIVQGSGDLKHWYNVNTNSVPLAPKEWVDRRAAGQPQRFYRLVNP